MNSEQTSAGANEQSDMLLWLAAALVVGIGLLWLVISGPWSSGSSDVAAATQPGRTAPAADVALAREAGDAPGQTAASASPSGTDGAGAARAGGLDDPLRMAELAYQAGMLIEPEGYSAWAFFGAALEAEPDSAPAREGLGKVADDLVKRGNSAVEQGRFDDARETAALIMGMLPEHDGARSLVARIEDLTRPPEPVRRVAAPTPAADIQSARAQAPSPAPLRATEVPESVPAPAPAPVVDPVEAMHEAFRRAMAENRLLTPPGDNARHHVQTMLDADAGHELAQSARDLLVTEMLARSGQALEALDTDAAHTWIDEAEGLGGDAVSVAEARARLMSALIAMESAKRLPASELTVRDYVAPVYPRNALHREIEGWVDVEFTVGSDGTTQNIRVAGGSHNSYFRDEAIEAVSQWRFEPRVFLDQAIPQQTYTRLRFVLGE